MPGGKLSIKLVVMPVKVCGVVPVTVMFQGDPVPPGIIEMASLAEQVGADITVNETVGAGLMVIVIACVTDPDSGQLLSV